MDNPIFVIIEDPVNGFLLSKKMEIIDQDIISIHLKDSAKSLAFLKETDSSGFPSVIFLSLDILQNDFSTEVRSYEDLISKRRAKTILVTLSNTEYKISQIENENYKCPIVPIIKPLETSYLIKICNEYSQFAKPYQVYLPKR